MSALIAYNKPPLSKQLQKVSDYFIALSNSTESLITNLKLQKLVYYAQSWHLALYGEPLFDEDFEAWVHGPVIPTLYNTYRDFKWNPILRDDLNDKSLIELAKEINHDEFLEAIVDEYFRMGAFALEKSTHSEDPWIDARHGLPADAPCNEIITKDSLVKYYKQFVINGE